MRAGVLMIAAMSLALGMGMRPDDSITREGSGQRRVTLDRMELKPAPNIWGDLTDWSTGAPLTADSIKGKVVVIGTWASYNPNSPRALETMERIAKANPNDVIVVGVHNKTGWESAKKVADDNKVTFAYAHDASGKVRSTLEVDADPDFYVIDRAGNMRYADIVTGAVDRAVTALVHETADDAAAVPTKLAAAAAKAEREASMTKTIASDLKPGQVLDVNFPLPDPSAYKDAKWPEKNTQQLSATDVQGSALPKSLGNETWITKKVNTNGRVLVLDFWATWCGPCRASMPHLDEIYKENKKDIVVLGISDEPRSTVENFIRSHPHAYPIATDEKRTINEALQIQGIPHVVIVSTDGVVRWQGHPMQPEFAKAVKQCIENDPGVAARRKAELEYLKEKGG